MEHAKKVFDLSDARARQGARQKLEPWTVQTPDGPRTVRRTTLTDVVNMIDEDAAMLSALTGKFTTVKDTDAAVGELAAKVALLVTLAPSGASNLLSRGSTVTDLENALMIALGAPSPSFERMTRLTMLASAVRLSLSQAAAAAFVATLSQQLNGE